MTKVLLVILVASAASVAHGQQTVAESVHWRFSATAIDATNPVVCFPRFGTVVTAEAFTQRISRSLTSPTNAGALTLVRDGEIAFDRVFFRHRTTVFGQNSPLTIHGVSASVDGRNFFFNDSRDTGVVRDDECVMTYKIDEWHSEPLLVGDSNLDGEFDSSDLVTIFRAAKYESGEAAIWTEGDWDFNNRFDTQDLILAFREDSYSRAAVPVPEARFSLAASLLLFLASLLLRQR